MNDGFLMKLTWANKIGRREQVLDFREDLGDQQGQNLQDIMEHVQILRIQGKKVSVDTSKYCQLGMIINKQASSDLEVELIYFPLQ